MDGRKVEHLHPTSHTTMHHGETKATATLKSNSTCGSAGNKHQPSARHPGHHPLPHQHQAGLHTHGSDDTSAALHLGATCTCESPAKGRRGHSLSKQRYPTTRNLRTTGTPNPRQTHPHLLLHVSTSQQRPPQSEKDPAPCIAVSPTNLFPCVHKLYPPQTGQAGNQSMLCCPRPVQCCNQCCTKTPMQPAGPDQIRESVTPGCQKWNCRCESHGHACSPHATRQSKEDQMITHPAGKVLA